MHADDVEAEADFLRAEGDIFRHIHLPLCDVSFLKAGCRELRNPTQRAGHISLSGLVFAHSRHNRVFLCARGNRRHKKAATVGCGESAV
jgi:hypothetical protein